MDSTLVQSFPNEGMRDPGVKKRLQEFDNKISVKLAKNKNITNNEDPSYGWHLDAYCIEDLNLTYDTESEIPEADEYWLGFVKIPHSKSNHSGRRVGAYGDSEKTQT